MKPKKIYLTFLISISILSSCTNSSPKESITQKEDNANKQLQLWHHEFDIGDEWTSQGNVPGAENIRLTRKVINVDTTYNNISCSLFETSGIIGEELIEIEGETFMRKNCVLSGLEFISKDENDLLHQLFVLEFDLSSSKPGTHLSLPMMIEMKINTVYDGISPKYPKVGETWKVTTKTSETETTWLGESIIEKTDTSYQETVESTFESVFQFKLLDTELKCLKIIAVTKDSTGSTTSIDSLLHSPDLKNNVLETEDINARMEVVEYNINQEKKQNEIAVKETDSGFDKFDIAVIIVLVASFILMMQLESLIFDSEGEVFRQLVSFAIAVIFYFLFATFIVRVLGVRDIVLFAALISSTCFVIPIFRD